MHVPFDTRSIGYDEHFFRQVGGGAGDQQQQQQENGPLTEPYRYFRGATPWSQRGFGARQSGAGIGDVLRHLWRIILPVVKRAAEAVGREALSTGGRVLDKVVKGENIKEATISEGKKGIDTLLEKGGMPKQFGGGRKKGAKSGKNHHRRSKPRPQSHQILIGKRVLPPAAAAAVGINPNLTSTSGGLGATIRRKRQRSDTFGLY